MNNIHGIPTSPSKLCILVEMDTVIYFSAKTDLIVSETGFIADRARKILCNWHDYKKNRNFISSFFAKLFRMDVEYDDKAETIKDWLRTL